jgi:hypothetical protein
MTNRLVKTIVPIVLLAAATQIGLAKEISFENMAAPARRVAQSEMSSGQLKRVEQVD